ncbi:MAG: hypothetical protein ACXAEN_18620 [Candidatus Thorarchaeota archaeon]|jgi:hypothetical protein
MSNGAVQSLANDDKIVLRYYIDAMVQDIHTGRANAQTVADFVALTDEEKVIALHEWAAIQLPLIEARLANATANRNKYNTQVNFINNYLA